MAGNSVLVSHIGIAVSDFDSAVTLYKLITGDQNPHIATVADQRVQVAIFRKPGEDGSSGGRVELVSPTDDQSPIAKFIAKRGEGLHHLCLYVKNIDEHIALLQKNSFRMIDTTPRVGAEGNRIAFMHPSSSLGVLIELEEISD